MKIQKPMYMPDAELSRKEMEEMQREIAGEAVFEDDLNFRPEKVQGKKVAGIDQAFLDEKAVSGVVLMEDGEVIEKAHAVTELEIPYIPGLLAFREGKPIAKALEKLESEPDLLMLDGSGRIHFREAGIATHIGVMFDKPSIGVAKNLLCGEPVQDTGNLEKGKKVEIKSDASMETSGAEVIGYAYQSKQFENRKINPLYVSSGHRIGAETSVQIVSSLSQKYKLPEPVRKADKYVEEAKPQFGNKNRDR